MPEYVLDTSGADSVLRRLDAFTLAYVEAAMWTLTDEAGNSCDHLGLGDIAPETIEKAILACAAFRHFAGFMLDDSEDIQAGHDFWLTRNRHGVGFWDRDRETYPNDPRGEGLTALAHSFGAADWYIGDDGLVYQG